MEPATAAEGEGIEDGRGEEAGSVRAESRWLRAGGREQKAEGREHKKSAEEREQKAERRRQSAAGRAAAEERVIESRNIRADKL